MYCTGRGRCRAIWRQGTAWYRRAAEQGERIAQYNLAVMLFRGDGVARDVEEALQWYEKAAEQGMPEAQTALGDLYAIGAGVAADPEAARRWYEKAASQGHAAAQAKLAGLRGPRLVTRGGAAAGAIGAGPIGIVSGKAPLFATDCVKLKHVAATRDGTPAADDG